MTTLKFEYRMVMEYEADGILPKDYETLESAGERIHSILLDYDPGSKITLYPKRMEIFHYDSEAPAITNKNN